MSQEIPIYGEVFQRERSLDPILLLASQNESQTQAETQLLLETHLEEGLDSSSDLKRKTTVLSDEATRKTKKVKVSIGLAVDLGD